MNTYTHLTRLERENILLMLANGIERDMHGKSWMMLHDGLGLDGKEKGYQLLGVNRNIKTLSGMTYQVSFDFASMPGITHENLSRVQVYAGDKLLGTAQGLIGNWLIG